MSLAFIESMEAIAFQVGNRLLPALSQAFDNAIAGQDDALLVDRELDSIAKMTLDITGIWMIPEFVTSVKWLMPYRLETESVNLNAIHPLNDVAVKKLSAYDFDNFNIYDTVNGYIDLKTGRVSGFFSQLRNRFLLSRTMFDGTFTGKELAALFLHEVGHAWVLYRYLCESLITNVIMAEIVGRIDVEDTIEKRVYLGTMALKFAGVEKDVDVQTAASADIAALVMEGQVTRIQRQAGSRWYDARLSEAMSDQFAARWMAGSAIVTASAKMERKKLFFMSSTGFDAPWVGIVSNIATISLLPFKLIPLGVRAVTVGILSKLAKAFFMGVTLSSTAGIVLNTKRYDTLPQRFSAMRRELVTLLKDRQLDEDARRQALSDIEIIDLELSSLHNYGDVMNKLAKFTIGAVTGRKQELDRHHTIEELANNRFYEVSALFKG